MKVTGSFIDFKKGEIVRIASSGKKCIVFHFDSGTAVLKPLSRFFIFRQIQIGYYRFIFWYGHRHPFIQGFIEAVLGCGTALLIYKIFHH